MIWILLIVACGPKTPPPNPADAMLPPADVTELTMAQFLRVQEAAMTIAEAALADGVGRPPREVREEALSDIRELPGVRDAGVSSDDHTIWIEYVDGREGALMLNPPGTR